MLSGLTAQTLGRYQEATRMVEETMSRLASGTADLGSADRIKVGRINNTIHTLQTANKVVKQNQDLLESALAGTDAITAVVNKMKEVATEAQDNQLTSAQRQALMDEYNELAQEIDYVAKNTEYDGTELLDGTFGTKSFIIDGVSSDQSVSVELGDITWSGLQLGGYTDDNNNIVGHVRSAAYSPTFKKVVGIAMINKPYWNVKDQFKLEINEKIYVGTVCDLPFF